MKECTSCHNKTEYLRYVCPYCGGQNFVFAGSPEDISAMVEAMQKQQQATEHVNRGGQFMMRGLYAEAETEFRKAFEINPYNANAYGNIGCIFHWQEQYEKAIPWFEKALEVNPYLEGIPEALQQATSAIEQKKRSLSPSETIESKLDRLNKKCSQFYEDGYYKEALEIGLQIRDLSLQHLGKDRPEFFLSLNNLAMVYMRMGNYEETESLLHQSIEIQRRVLGENHSSFAQSLNGLASLYYLKGNYKEAEPLYRRAIEIQRENSGEDNLTFAEMVSNLASLYDSIGKYEDVEPLLRQAMEITRRIIGEDHSGFANSLSKLAGLYESIGRYKDAEPLYRQSVEIMRRIKGEDHPLFPVLLNNLAGLYEAVGKYTEAETLLHQSIEINRKVVGEYHPGFAASLHRMAGLYQSMGKYKEAEPLYQRAIEINRKVLGEEHPHFAAGLQNLALFYSKIGKYKDAEPLCQQAIDIQRIALGENHPEVATSLKTLADLYRETGRYSEAEHLYRQSMEIRRNVLGEEHPILAASLNNLALLYEETKNYAEAANLFHQSNEIDRKVFGKHHPKFASELNNLAMLYLEIEDYPKAEPLFLQAIEIRRKAVDDNPFDLIVNLSNLANLYTRTDRHEEAESLLREAKEIIYQIDGEEHPKLAMILHNLAFLYYLKGNYNEAESLYRRVIEIDRNSAGEQHQDFAISLSCLASVCAATDREAEALSLEKQAADIYDRLLGQVFAFASETHRMSFLNTLTLNFDRYLSLVFRNPSASEVQSALKMVLRRKTITAEALAIQRDAVLGGRYPELEPQLKTWSALQMQIAQKTLEGPGQEGLDSHREILAALNILKNECEAELARQIPEMNLEERLRQVDLETVARLLPKQAALIEFVRFDMFDFKAVPSRRESQWKPPRYLAFVIPAREPEKVEMIDLGEAEPIDQMIAAFCDSVIQEGERGFRNIGVVAKTADVSAEEDGIRLTRTIFKPLLPALDGYKRLFLAPDGDLARLPFEILPLDNGRRVIGEYHISYLGAGRDILRFGQTSTRQPTAPLVVADPDFDLGRETEHYQEEQKQQLIMDRGPSSRHSRELDESHIHFKPLEGTRIEGERISDMLGVQPWFGRYALEARLKACRSPRILHIATHGFFLTDQERDPNEEMRGFRTMGLKGFAETGFVAGTGLENPLLRSGLALAGANTFLQEGNLPPDAEDGLLTAEDVTGLDLLDTELVVLSACETGLGEVHVGEGVFGLRRSFVIAGAKTLVMSLWKVPDKQTQELMVDFYQRLLKGEGRAEALRNAQLAMKAKYPHPFYWGAFICQGDPAPLPKNELK